MQTSFLELDVRALMEEGRNPLPRILHAAASLEPGQALRLTAPVEPKPLYPILARQGLGHTTTQNADDSWTILFYREADDPGTGRASVTEDRETESEVPTIDVRGLAPPQPLMRVMEAIASLTPGERLRAVTPHRPECLLGRLHERGLNFETRPGEEQGTWVTLITA